MILQALKEYYDRKLTFQGSEDESVALEGEDRYAPLGFKWERIPWVITIDRNGTPLNIECTRKMQNGFMKAKQFLVLRPVKRTVNTLSNTLWDNAEYSLGLNRKGSPERTAKRHMLFIETIQKLELGTDEAIRAVIVFLKQVDKVPLLEVFKEWENLVADEGATVTFKLAGDTCTVSERAEVRRKLSASVNTPEAGFCLISGSVDTIERIHPAIQGVKGTKQNRGNIVSFNCPAFRSYHKTQGLNAPIGKIAADAYTKALSGLLQNDDQHIHIGDTSTVFWSKKPDRLEQVFPTFFSDLPNDDPDRMSGAVRDLFRSVETGVLNDQGGNEFYVLGLAPNAGRISIRFWLHGRIAEMAGAIRQHFLDIQMIHRPKEHEFLPLNDLLLSIAIEEKRDNIPSHLLESIMRAILERRQYPRALLQAALVRTRAKHEVNYARASIVKACLNRISRASGTRGEKEMQMSLDPSNRNAGYLLGRLFAALERVQEEASPGINATIRDRFYGAASSTPVTVFGNLMRQKNHHIAKIENVGRVVFYEKLIGQIVEGIDDFPSHLSLDDQGRFAIGYYHQRQEFYTKKADKVEETGVQK